jgi:hypothetical protein
VQLVRKVRHRGPVHLAGSPRHGATLLEQGLLRCQEERHRRPELLLDDPRHEGAQNHAAQRDWGTRAGHEQDAQQAHIAAEDGHLERGRRVRGRRGQQRERREELDEAAHFLALLCECEHLEEARELSRSGCVVMSPYSLVSSCAHRARAARTAADKHEIK